MAAITRPIETLTYTGPPLSLPSAGFLGNLTRVYRLNSTGTVFVGFTPGSTVNGFTQLEDGQTYIFYSAVLPYTIPTTAPATGSGGGSEEVDYVFADSFFER